MPSIAKEVQVEGLAACGNMWAKAMAVANKMGIAVAVAVDKVKAEVYTKSVVEA